MEKQIKRVVKKIEDKLYNLLGGYYTIGCYWRN